MRLVGRGGGTAVGAMLLAVAATAAEPEPPRELGRWDSLAGVLATTYAKPGKALVALASWEKDPVDVALTIDWKTLGPLPARARLTAPPIEGFQPAASFAPADRIRVEPGRGWLPVLAP